MQLTQFLSEHDQLTRRFFLSATGAAAVAGFTRNATAQDGIPEDVLASIEPWLTKPDDFGDVSRGKPKPHSLSPEKRAQVGLTRETWKLEVVSDPDDPARIGSSLTKATGSALDFAGLMQLAENKAVRFPKIMTCLNIGCPLGMGIWEGVPLREVIWQTQPKRDFRRIYYHGYHNDDPEQMFRSSLPVGRVLEDPFDLPPVILCYKLNGQWLTPERGGPVRIVVPEAYGFKSIKWLQQITLSNKWRSNDTYGEQNNDVDSHLKTFAATLTIPDTVAAGQQIAVTGYAQVGISGLAKVQVSLQQKGEERPSRDRHYRDDPWQDATVLGPPVRWGGGLPDGIPSATRGFDSDGRPRQWPLPLSRAHWAVLLNGVPQGEYTFRCRTIDAKGAAQPLPRPFRKSGHAAIESKTIKVG